MVLQGNSERIAELTRGISGMAVGSADESVHRHSPFEMLAERIGAIVDLKKIERPKAHACNR